ncbi:SurA N-terminal domain-containing protein [Notoacmeibacter sp. MSK16QG-6]|uniref:SurA N-terminal domain-containing protein n=1 Tax=Notoacmeibacter sp. MSK16QG-6 TaxID=2957982 RepID=UPI0020A00FFB|nr:SurA N-terminal domain-containing protein [Notoacmeibacter sp. MSK16QG-6]MCP1197979.1 SurA N-terminal domain-containing protein [Notoacmeibacter sp. MSK16QG-6]
MSRHSRYIVALALSFTLSCLTALAVTHSAAASEIKIVVNKVPITSYDLARRAAFLKLQRKKGNLRKLAEDEMIEDALKRSAVDGTRIQIADAEVDAYFERFAKSNKLTSAQLTQILGQAGVTARHYKDFIRTQMAWAKYVRARLSAEKRKDENDITKQILARGGEKPTATEYILQQVIFVVPQAERGSRLAARTKEAEAMRQRFRDCESTPQFARGLLDVTVRNLGRKLAPELPDDWASLIKGLEQGQTTKVRQTEKGAEFIAVCRTRSVSDDQAAEMVWSAEENANGQGKETQEKILAELREKANIQRK